MSVLQTRLTSSLEKCFLDESLTSKPRQNAFFMFRNERLSFQLIYQNSEIEHMQYATVRVQGEMAPYATLREVVSIPSMYPVAHERMDEHYLRTEPGLYPDLLRPLHSMGRVALPYGQLHAVWVDLSLPEDFAPGQYTLTISLHAADDALLASETATVQVLAAALPPQQLIRTEWFYTDCLAEYYHTPVFSERHWQIIEQFIRTAVQNGINMILTPIFTPELDTYIGGERLTTQLVDITVTEPGVYTFGFEKLERWIALCLRCGVEYFEIPHFFTQWGAHHAPKIVAKVNGRSKRIFGWETDALGDGYPEFLEQLIPAVLAVFHRHGLDRKLFFHVSDEPNLKSLEQFTRCREILTRSLAGYPIIDALSDYAFYETGAISKPVPAIKHIEPFLTHHVPGLWAYYCGAGGCTDTTNRYFSMSLARVRILGVQLYLNHIEGFLHWGYNFYHNRYSYDFVDPFGCSDGEGFAPSGDTYLVYPGDDGTAWESLRLNAMREAMDDMRALELCESLRGRAFTEALIREEAGEDITFTQYPHDTDFLLRLRRRIAEAVEPSAAQSLSAESR